MIEAVAGALPEVAHWVSCPGRTELSALPGCAAVYMLSTDDERPVQLASTQHLRRAVIARLCRSESVSPVRADLTELVRTVRWRQVSHPLEARWRYFELARLLYPEDYRKLVSFGPAWFLHVDWARPIPDIRVSERVWRLSGEFIGPWPTQRACQQALEGLWDLFDLCRYPEQVRKAPGGTRCSYAEMGRCDAPCDGSAPLAAYLLRSQAAWHFASGGVEPWITDATSRMHSAAQRRQFELAGQLKQQIAFARGWVENWSSIVRPVALLRLVIALPVTRRKAWKLLAFMDGAIADGPIVGTRKLGDGLRSWLATVKPDLRSTPDDEARMEYTWLLAHFLHHREAKQAAIVRVRHPIDAEEVAAVVLRRAGR
jgi:DNA polymerase-3 subunit epsilon